MHNHNLRSRICETMKKNIWFLTTWLFLTACSPALPQPEAPSSTPAPTNSPQATPAITETPMPTVVPSPTPFGEVVLAPELNDESPIPVTGIFVPELQNFDQAIVNFMLENGIGAGTLAISRRGEIVLEHGYGWNDQQHTMPINPGTSMRFASVVKPITKAIIVHLNQEREIKLNTKVFCINENTDDCLLSIEPPEGQNIDPLMENITVSHLLDHKGGWDQENSFDPMFASIEIASALGIPGPPGKVDIAKFMMGQPLDFRPGSREAYSNYGYLLLGLIIEEVTGQQYISYLQDYFLGQLGIYDIELARTLLEDRSNPREIAYYHCPGRGENVFSPGSFVCWPDGGWYIEAMDAHGGLVASSRTIATFLDHYCMGNGLPRNSACGKWIYFGSLDGTHSMAYQVDDISLAVHFNRRGPNSEQIYEILSEVIDDTEVWP